MARALTDARIKQFEDVVRSELQPLQDVAEAVEGRARFAVENKLREELGLNAVLKQLSEMRADVAKLEMQVEKFMGPPPGQYHRNQGPYDYHQDSLFGKEVTSRMAQMNGVIGEWRMMHRDAISAVHLADAPESVIALLAKIKAAMPTMFEKLQNTAKTLPAPPRPEDVQGRSSED